MAHVIAFQNGPLLTPGTFHERVSSTGGIGYFSVDISDHALTTTSYVGRPSTDGPNGEVTDGVMLYLNKEAGGTGTFSVRLADNGIDTVREVTVDVADLPATPEWTFFRFADYTTVDAVAKTTQVKSSVAGSVTVYKSASAGNWARIYRKALTSEVPVAGDFAYVVGELSAPGVSEARYVTPGDDTGITIVVGSQGFYEAAPTTTTTTTPPPTTTTTPPPTTTTTTPPPTTTTTVPPIVLCPDCPSTSTTPPTCPDPPDGSNCCLQVRYTCDGGVWTLASSECVDNALCSPFIEVCTGTEFYYEMQDGCVCFSVPATVCEPADVDCECAAATTTTTTTPPPTTTTTVPPLACGSLAPTPTGGTWALDAPPPFPVGQLDELDILIPAISDVFCCYQIDLVASANAVLPGGAADLHFAQIGVSVAGHFGSSVTMYSDACDGTPIGSSISDGRDTTGALSINQTVFVCVVNGIGAARPYVRWTAQLNNNIPATIATLDGSFQQTVTQLGISCTPPP